MANYKLVLDDDMKADFLLIALHCTEPEFKIAYLLNKQLGIRLVRCNVDLDYSRHGLEISFPRYEFEDEQAYVSYDLLANKCKTTTARTVASGGLFSDQHSEDVYIEYLMPELQKVDYLLKVSSDFGIVPTRKLLNEINQINQVISAYEIEVNTLKSKHNLIFD